MIPKILRNIGLMASLACLTEPTSLLAQGSPDIIWKQHVNVDRVNSVIFTPDGNTLISGGSDRLINFWRVSDGALLRSLNTNAPFIHDSAIESLSITPDGSLLASCSYKIIQLWDLPSGTERKLNGHTDWVVGVAFSPDGSLLASAGFDTTVRIWRASDGGAVRVLQGSGQQRCVAFSPDGSLLASAAGDNNVTLWSTATWTAVRTLTGHTDDIFAIAFSPDGNTLASGGYDDTVKLWNVADGSLKSTLSGNAGNVYSVAFTPDGSKVAYTDGEGSTVRIYRVADATLLQKFTEEVNEVQTLSFSKDGLMGYGRVDTTVVLANVGGTATPRPRITVPAPGATFNAPANITITASPSKTDGTITQMEFFQNGTKLGEDATSPYTFSWTNVAAGTYTLTAVDTDLLGATTTSTPVTITVVNQSNAPPTVWISSPSSGATFTQGANIIITASASAAAGVASVEFFQNGTSLGQDASSPFTIGLNTGTIGTYNLTATITDRNGATATSDAVIVSVTEAPPETIKPRVTIATPAAGARLTSPDTTLSGSASDNIGVAQVLYSLNSAPFVPASGTVNWEANITLVPGLNVVQVKSLDTAGNESAIVSRSFTYVLSAQLALQISGLGAVTPLRDGQVLEVGKTYSIKAVPARDNVFAGWTGSVMNSAPTISFVMTQGMSLTATFVPNPFAAKKGTYFGLIQPPTPSHDHSGFLQINVTQTGSFSGKIAFGARKYSLRGKFSGDGTWTGKHSGSGLTLTLLLHLNDDSDQITGSISDGAFTSLLVGDRSSYSAQNPSPQKGVYTILIPANTSQVRSPQGEGFGLLKVDASGKTRVAGSLADGTKFSQSAGISKIFTWPFYVQAYNSRGSILGNIRFRNQVGISDLDGTVDWTRPANPTANIFKDGFITQTILIGSTYLQPSGQPVLTVSAHEGNVVVSLGQGDLESELQKPATLAVNNQVVIPASNDEKLRLTFSPSSGTLRGSFVHPATGRTTKHSGVVFQKQNLAEGYFLGSEKSGFVSIVPADDLDSGSDDDEDPPIIIDPPPDPDPIPIPEPEPIPQTRKKKR